MIMRCRGLFTSYRLLKSLKLSRRDMATVILLKDVDQRHPALISAGRGSVRFCSPSGFNENRSTSLPQSLSAVIS